VLYPDSRIANLLFYQSGFRREYSIRRRAEHPIAAEGGRQAGLTALSYRRGPRGADCVVFYRQAPRGADCVVFSKLMSYDCV